MYNDGGNAVQGVSPWPFDNNRRDREPTLTAEIIGRTRREGGREEGGGGLS